MQDPDPAPSRERLPEGERVRPSKPVRKKDYPGALVLVGKSPMQVIGRLVNGDPLHLRQALVDHLRDQAICIDPHCLIEMVIARVAHDAMTYEGEPMLSTFLDECIHQAIHSYLERESERDAKQQPIENPEDPFLRLLSELLGIERSKTRAVSLHFHRLPLATRRTFQAILIEQTSVHRWVAEGHGPPARVMAQLEYAIEVMSTLGKTEMPDPDIKRPGEDKE